jgi:hypothetical protein
MTDAEYEKRFGVKERAARAKIGQAEPAGYQGWLKLERDRLQRKNKKERINWSEI